MPNSLATVNNKMMRNISWKPRSAGWVMLNTEGASKNGSVAGCGSLIRGSSGE
jgi:hypothetical protein